MEVFDDPEAPTVTAQVEVPGMKTNEVSLQIREDRLVVSGERRPNFAVGECRDFDETSGHLATETREENQAPGEGGGNSSPTRPAASKFPVQELKYGKFVREISVPTGLQVSWSVT
jgi:HSP20 family protein